MLSTFQPLIKHIRLKKRSELLNWSNFGNINWIFGLLYESGVHLVEVAENNFVLMTAVRVCSDDIIADILTSSAHTSPRGDTKKHLQNHLTTSRVVKSASRLF